MLPDFRVRQRDYLLEISRAITEELELDAVLARILESSAELLAGDAGLIALRDASGGWRVAAAHGIPPALIRFLDPLLSDIPDHGDPARFALPEVNRRLNRIAQAASMGLLTGVALPLIARKEVMGLIFIFRGYEGRFSSNDRALLQSFADQAAIAVQNARLYTQVAEEKNRLDAILDSSADGVVILDPAHRILRFNRALGRMTGWPPEEAVGRSHEDLLQWIRVESGPTLEQAEAGGWPLASTAALYVEGDLRRKDGTPLSVGVTYAPLFSRDGHLVNLIGSVRDITKFREAEELKSTFISIISHELKTPVALIKGYASTLRREDARWDSETVQESLQVIEEESDRLAQLIDDLLDASRLQAGAMSLNHGDVDLCTLAKRLVEKFGIQSSRHTLETDFPHDFPVIVGDEERLTQVLSNLLSNAIKYSPKGGTITLSGRAEAERVVVCVTDQGPGIAPEDQSRVFDRFYRAKSSLTRHIKGTGLGLFLAKAIVDAHGGRVWVDPSPKQGARVCFSLPR